MLTEDQLDRVVVVLVRARNPNNIGAVARALYDFGFRHLRLVNAYPVSLSEARSAVDAVEVLDGAQEFTDLSLAVADCHLVVGTTAGGKRVQEHPLYSVAEGSGLLRAHLAGPQNRVALLFGSEKTGLSREELSHCHWTMTIPMQTQVDARHPSMNLGQAAAVCLYELAQKTELPAALSQAEEAPPAIAADVERLTQLLIETLEAGGYRQRHPANSDDEHVRRLVRRMQMNATDVEVWMGMLRLLLRKLQATSCDGKRYPERGEESR